jgi:tripartite-type tricarboxylate transporter receptor subunit TctC
MRNILRVLLAAVATCAALPAAGWAAETFPEKPVRIIVPYPAGGPVDGITRALALHLQAKWKQPVLVVNRPGANEIIAAEHVAKSAPDGYTIFAATEAALTVNPYLYRNLPYNAAKDFAPVTRVIDIPMVVLVPSTLPVKSMQDFIALAKTNISTPLAYGSSGQGGVNHLPLAMLEKNEGIVLNHIPYKGAAPIIPDLIAGTVQISAIAASVVEQHIRKGSLRGLAVSAESRLASLPDVPTFKELGMKDIGARFGVGLVVPAGTPAPVIKRISDDVSAIMQDPAFVAQYVTPMSYVATGNGTEEYTAFLQRDASVQQGRVMAAGVKLD